MIAFPAGAKVWIAGGTTDMRRGMNTLALQVQEVLGRAPMRAISSAFEAARAIWSRSCGMMAWACRFI